MGNEVHRINPFKCQTFADFLRDRIVPNRCDKQNGLTCTPCGNRLVEALAAQVEGYVACDHSLAWFWQSLDPVGDVTADIAKHNKHVQLCLVTQLSAFLQSVA